MRFTIYDLRFTRGRARRSARAEASDFQRKPVFFQRDGARALPVMRWLLSVLYLQCSIPLELQIVIVSHKS